MSNGIQCNGQINDYLQNSRESYGGSGDNFKWLGRIHRRRKESNIVTPAEQNQRILSDVATLAEPTRTSALMVAISPIQPTLPINKIKVNLGVSINLGQTSEYPVVVLGEVSNHAPILLFYYWSEFVFVLASGTQIYLTEVPLSRIPPQVTPVL